MVQAPYNYTNTATARTSSAPRETTTTTTTTTTMTMTPQLQLISSSSSSISPSSEITNQSRINAGALLDEYTNDDDQTMDLLHAIRNWNLEQRASSDSCDGTDSYNHGNGNGHASNGMMGGNGNHNQAEACCNSTIATNSYSHDGHTTWTSDQDKHSQSQSNSQSNSHSQSKGILSTPKTPSMCNYSSRPSALTAMILERTANRESGNSSRDGSSSSHGVPMGVGVVAASGGGREYYHKSVLESPTEVDEDEYDEYEQEQNENNDGNGNANANGNANGNGTRNINRHGMTHTRPLNKEMEMEKNRALYTSPPPHPHPPSYVTTRDDTFKNERNKIQVDRHIPMDMQIQRSKKQQQQQQQEQHQQQQHPHPHQQQEYEAMKILSQTAELLGLNHGPNGSDKGETTNIHAVLPTIQKLVKVITQHVPRLEQFVEQVCDIVEDEGQALGQGQGQAHVHNGEQQQQKKKKKKKRPSRKNMEARKERMDHAVDVLRREWKGKKEYTEAKKGGGGGGGEEKEDQGHTRNDRMGTNTTSASSSSTSSSSLLRAEAEAATLFRKVVKNKISTQSPKKRSRNPPQIQEEKVSDFARVMTPTSSNRRQGYNSTEGHENGDYVSDAWTDEEALEELDRLIRLQQKYNTLEQLAQLQVTVEQQPPPPHSSSSTQAPHHISQPWQSPTHILSNNTLPPSPDHDTVIAELLNANTTTLRKFVLHFAYLFHVKQDEVVTKMNALYVFSQEANEMISQVKGALGLGPDCPIHYVAREVLGHFNDRRRENSASYHVYGEGKCEDGSIED